MRLPLWSWPNMSDTETQRLAAFVEALRNHEMGHRAIAVRALEGRRSRLTVVRDSRLLAIRALQAALASDVQATYAEISRTEILYDRVTDHGTRQGDGPAYGFRGGENVAFGCS